VSSDPVTTSDLSTHFRADGRLRLMEAPNINAEVEIVSHAGGALVPDP